jgi:hypothetical protein
MKRIEQQREKETTLSKKTQDVADECVEEFRKRVRADRIKTDLERMLHDGRRAFFRRAL